MRNSPEQPIFIGGLDRSGKTLLGQMLSSHPKISITRRTYMWTQFYRRYGSLSQIANFEMCLAAMLQHKPIQALQPDPERIRREFWEGEPTYARLFALFHAHYAGRIGKPRWGDQLAFVEHYAGPIFEAYPGAKMIHMIRRPPNRLAASLEHRRLRKGKVGWDTARWLYSIRLAQSNSQHYPGRYKIVQYEALTCQPEMTIREITSFLEEEFHPEMLEMLGVVQPGGGDPAELDAAGLLGREFIQESSESEARARMSGRDIRFIQAYAGKAMQAVGYPPESIRLSFPNLLLYYFFDWPVNLAGISFWMVKKDQRIA